MTKRIASLLPSATEIVCALGAQGELVGRSHECDFPSGLETLPVLTRPRVFSGTSLEIDVAVRGLLESALAVYDIELERLRQARPDVIVTQDLCDVCAVSLEDVRAAVLRLARQDVEIVNLHPTRLSDIWTDIATVGRGIGRQDEAATLVAASKARVREIARRAEAALGGKPRPRVLTVEWIAPVMLGGMWMPDLVELASGEALVTKSGEHAPTLRLEELERLEPDVVLVKPCGFDLPRTFSELEALRAALPWTSWRAVKEGRVFAADGNAYFNRPGPRIVESLEILAACLHPGAFPDFVKTHGESVVRLEEDLGASRLVA
jgi:iron complex transport system substrate-binding protein